MDYVPKVTHKPAMATYVTVDCQVVEQERKRITPNRLKTSCPPGSKFVIRFGPRSKLWEAYDLRKFICNPIVWTEFYSAPPPSLTHANKDSVVGWALLTP